MSIQPVPSDPELSAGEKCDSAVEAGRTALRQRSGAEFYDWVTVWGPQLSPTEWSKALLALVNYESADMPVARELLSQIQNHREACRVAIQLLCREERTREVGILSQELAQIKETSVFLLNPLEMGETIAREADREEQLGHLAHSTSLRERTFEAGYEDLKNLLKIVVYYVSIEDEFSACIYARYLADKVILGQPFFQTELQGAAARFYRNGKYEVFFEVFRALIKTKSSKERPHYYAIYSTLARYFSPDREDEYQGQWDELSHSITSDVSDFIMTSKAFIPVAQSLESRVYKLQPKTLERLNDLCDMASFYGFAGANSQLKQSVQRLIEEWPVEDIQNIDLDEPESSRILCRLTFSLTWSMGYCSDNVQLLRSYQNVSSRLYSKNVRKMFESEVSELLSLSSDVSCQRERPLKVGYLSSTFHRHSVGHLSHQALAYHDPCKVQSYLYAFGKDVSDNIRTHFVSNAYHFRNLTALKNDVLGILNEIRRDQLDILVYLDNMTSVLGWEVMSLRAAPIQMCWLGSDAPGIPTVEYFLVDPFILHESVAECYAEKLLRIPTYIAVDRFEIFEIELRKFRLTLEIPDSAVVFWTAAIGYKRNPECIDRQLEIVKAVPNSVLVVKGLSDMPTVMNSFEEAAKEKGIEKQLRILELTTREESHRAQLGLVDVILDTFPYSGATHSMEALWRGVPILTQVGDHYYSRMTYSILENIGEFDACIARSGAEYVEKGIELGRNAALRAQLRQRLRDTRKTSVVWDAWRLARSLEAAYHHVIAGGSVEGYVAHPEDLPDLTFSSAREWNQAGVDLFRQGCRAANIRERRSFWEKALEAWRQGAIYDPNSLPCAFNRIFLREMLGDLEYSLREAATLLDDMETDRYDGECFSSQVEEELIWLPKSLGSDVKSSLDTLGLYVLTRWLAEHSGVLYRQEVLRFWQLAIELCPEDIEARMVVGLNQLHQGNIGGIEHIDYVLTRDPDFARASTARSLERYSRIERDSRGWVQPGYIQGFQATVAYEGVQLSLEPTLRSIGTLVLLARGEWFEQEVDFCRRWLKPGMTVFDVGANVGVYTFLAARYVGERGKVYAVEPTPECISCLQRTVEANQLQGRVIPVAAAVGEQPGEVYLVSEGASVFNRIVATKVEAGPRQTQPIEQITLDRLWREEGQPHVDLIKVDTEGVELQTVRGAKTLLETCKPLVIFENISGSTPTGKAVASFLKELNYQFFIYQAGLKSFRQVFPEDQPLQALNIIASVEPPEIEISL